MTSIEPRTLKTLMNLWVLTISTYPLLSGSFRFFQLCSIGMSNQQPLKLHGCIYRSFIHVESHTHTTVTLALHRRQNITYPSFQHVGRAKREDQGVRSPPPALDKGPSRSASKSSTIIWIKSCWESTMAPPKRFPWTRGTRGRCLTELWSKDESKGIRWYKRFLYNGRYENAKRWPKRNKPKITHPHIMLWNFESYIWVKLDHFPR